MLATAELSHALSTFNPTRFSRLDILEIWKYVDDVFTATGTIPKGCNWPFEHNVLIWSEETHKTDTREPDARTMEEMAKVSSSIFKCLNFTWDCPSQNGNAKMPVLDTQLWVGLESRESSIPEFIDPKAPKICRQDTLKRVILFQFFKKPMASRSNNLYRSGIPLGSNIATGTKVSFQRIW